MIDLNKYFKDFDPVNDQTMIEEGWAHLVQMPPREQKERSREDEFAGRVLLLPLWDTDKREHFFLEYVKCLEDIREDSVTTLYHQSQQVKDLDSLLAARKELITEVAARFQALPSTMTVFDAGRQREVWLRELGTAQLVDILAMSQGHDILAA